MTAPSDLPPRPDPWTGLPEPPPAPGPRGIAPRRRMPTRPRQPPPGRGPVLAGESGEPRHAVVSFVVGLAVVGGFLLVVSGGDVLSGRAWPFAVVLVLLLVAWARGAATDYLAAGADWLQVHRSWVDLYDLVEVRVVIGAYALPMLVLRDAAGRDVREYLYSLRGDPLVWDLVHLGIRWSRATNEVKVNPRAEQLVGDDPVPGGAYLVRRRRVEVERVRRDDPRTEELPPRPDPWTCDPFPPPAPWTSPGALVRFPTRPQTPPPGRGPVLAGRSGFDPRGIVVMALLGVGLIAALNATTGFGWIIHGTIDLVFLGSCYLLIVVALGWALTASYSGAGTGWAADEQGWVDLYDLVSVRRARARWRVPGLELTDGEGRRVVLPLRALRTDELLGRFVHLGIRWSRALNVVELDEGAAELLGPRHEPA